jgi:tetratricopeptide (TPR) repeat protein
VNGNDPAHELREALTDALMRVPLISSSGNRRLLISLIRRDITKFPDVEERHEVRLHVVELVLVCLEQPARLRALRNALMLMAPDDGTTQRACELIDSATLLSLLSEVELQKARDLLHQVAEEAELVDWRVLAAGLEPGTVTVATGLVDAFDQLVRCRLSQDHPPALTLVARTAATPARPAVALRSWLEEICARMALPTRPPDAEVGVVAERLVEDPNEPTSGIQISGDFPKVATEPGPADGIVPAVDSNLSDIVSNGDGGQSEPDGRPPRAGDVMPPVATDESTDTRLPQVWGEVPPRNPNFTGRNELLAHLHTALLGNRSTAVLPQAVYGMGGVGKSQLVNEYVHRHRSELDLVWWIPAENESQILASLTKLAQRLKLETGPEANIAVPAVREALSTGKIKYTNWLLVFDNAESVKDVLAFFPTGGAGKILVTSRNPQWSRVARSLEVDVFTRDESKTFLMARTPELSEPDADRLAEALGDLPLAVEQAAAWRAATGMPVSEYLKLLEDKRLELFEDAPSPDYQTSVAAAWNVSLDRLEQVNPAALQLLQVCAYFAPEPISREFFSGSAIASITETLDNTLSDPVALARAIRAIQRFSLARLDHRYDTLQIHRLVQAVLIGRMNEEQREVMRSGAHTLLAGANPHAPSVRTSWDRYQALLPHVVASRVVESEDPSVQRLAYETVEFMYHWGDHKGCVEFAEDLYEQRVRLFGEDHPETLKLAKYLGFVKVSMGDFREAVDLFERALTFYSAAGQEDDEERLDAMRMMGHAYHASGEFQQARQILEKGHQICLRALGPDDPITLEMANSLGVSLRLTGDFRRALDRDEDTYRRAVEVWGKEYYFTLLSLYNLNISVREAGNYLAASRQQEETYRQSVEVFGPERPFVWRVGRDLAVARRRAGDHATALTLAQDIATRFRRRYGENHPDTMSASLSLAVDLRHARDWEGSRLLGEETLARYRTMCGDRHPFTLSAQINLAIVMRLQGDSPGAYEMNQQTFERLAEQLGPDHPVVLSCATNLASDLFAQGKLDSAFDLDTDTLSRSERVLGVEHPSTLAVGVNLSLDLRGRGREQEAAVLHSDTMERFRRTLGEQHPATLNAMRNLRADCDVDIMPI